MLNIPTGNQKIQVAGLFARTPYVYANEDELQKTSFDAVDSVEKLLFKISRLRESLKADKNTDRAGIELLGELESKLNGDKETLRKMNKEFKGYPDLAGAAKTPGDYNALKDVSEALLACDDFNNKLINLNNALKKAKDTSSGNTRKNIKNNINKISDMLKGLKTTESVLIGVQTYIIGGVQDLQAGRIKVKDNPDVKKIGLEKRAGDIFILTKSLNNDLLSLESTLSKLAALPQNEGAKSDLDKVKSLLHETSDFENKSGVIYKKFGNTNRIIDDNTKTPKPETENEEKALRQKAYEQIIEIKNDVKVLSKELDSLSLNLAIALLYLKISPRDKERYNNIMPLVRELESSIHEREHSNGVLKILEGLEETYE